MQTISRVFAVAVCAMTATACNRLSDAKLAGIWRAEDDTTINEIACRSDHTFTSWTSWKNVLTTPSVGIGAGDWRLQDHQLIVHLKKYVLVDTWADEDKEIAFKILKSDNDALLIKNFDDNKTVTYKRLLPDHVLTPMKRAPTDADVVGIWRIHFNTQDYEMLFSRDHTYGSFVQAEGVRQQLFSGTWHIDGNQLRVGAKSVPMFEGESIDKSELRWVVTAVEPQRIAIKDGPVSYCLERSK